MLNIAYIGNGKSTNRYHIPFALKSGKFNINTIFSRHKNNQWAPINGVFYTEKLSDVFENPEIDLVVVNTPTEFHYHYAKQALEHNKNVLVEKPFSETLAEAIELFELASKKELFIQAYQNRRFDSDFLTVQKVIHSKVLGELLEVEMHYDYFRPEIPKNTQYSRSSSFLFGHGCHTVDQVLSYFGFPQKVSYDVRQLLGKGGMNDYFDLDFYYDTLKVSVKSSYFRIKERPSFAVYGKNGSFIKQTKDRQEDDLKHFYMPTHSDFGVDFPEQYGVLTYIDKAGLYHEEKVPSEKGDYSRLYTGVYNSITKGSEKIVKDCETIQQIKILETGVLSIEKNGGI